MAAIKRLAVKEESILVHRIRLGKIVQSPGMGIRSFLANLRGQAALCNYTAKCSKCPHTHDYSAEIIKDHLIRGIADPEILSELVGDTTTDRTLEETVKFIAQKEQGKATRSVVGDSTNVIQSKTSFTPLHTGRSSCWACGGSPHGPRNDKDARSQRCPAWTFTCVKCSVKGHFSKYCSKCSDCSSWGHRDKSSRFCTQSPRAKSKQREMIDKSKTEFSSTKSMTLVEEEQEPSVFHQLCGSYSEPLA